MDIYKKVKGYYKTNHFEFTLFGVILLVTLLLFESSWHFPFFIFDDNFHLNRPSVQDPSLFSFIEFWKISKTPLVFNIWQGVSFFFGSDSAVPYRLLNFFTHAVNAFLVFIVIRTFIAKAKLVSLVENKNLLFATIFGSLIFLVHPTSVESVVWVSSFRTIGSTTFGLLSFLFYLRHYEEEKVEFGKLFLAFIFFGMGMLIKPSVSSLFFVYLFIDIYLFKKKAKDVFAQLAPFLIVIILMVSLLLMDVYGAGGDRNLKFYERMILVFKGISFYIEKAILPVNLGFLYQENISKALKMGILRSWETYLLVFGVISFVYVTSIFEKLRMAGWGAVLFLLLLTVNLGFISHPHQNLSLFADRYLYFPLFGFSLISTILFYNLLEFKKEDYLRKSIIVLASSIIIIFSIGTVRQVSVWKSSVSVFENSLKNNPKSFEVMFSLAVAKHAEGDFKGALEGYKKASTLKIASGGLETNLFKLFYDLNRLSRDAFFGTYNPAKTESSKFQMEQFDYLLEIEKLDLALEYFIRFHPDLLGARVEELLEKVDRHVSKKIGEAAIAYGDLMRFKAATTGATQEELEAAKYYEEGLKRAKELQGKSRADFFNWHIEDLNKMKNGEKRKE